PRGAAGERHRPAPETRGGRARCARPGRARGRAGGHERSGHQRHRLAARRLRTRRRRDGATAVKIREVLSRLDRAQRSTPFTIVASIIVVAVAVAIFATYFVAVTAPAGGPVPAAPDPTAQVDPALEAQ